MRTQAGYALLMLGVGMAISAMLGPLGFGIIEMRVSDTMQNQLLGGEVVSLFLAAPVAVIAGALWRRGHRFAPALGIAPALYAVYTYPQFIIGPDYNRYTGNNERAFPLYLALVLLGWVSAVAAWSRLGQMSLSPPARGLTRALAGVLVALSLAIGLAWIASAGTLIRGGTPTLEYINDPTLFWMIRLLDLGVIIPVSLITAIGLLRQTPWAARLAYALGGFQTLLTASVASMAITMAVRDDPSTSYLLLVVTTSASLALATLTVGLLRHLTGPSSRTSRHGAPAHSH